MSLIPFNRASIVGKECEFIRQAVGNMHISGDGPFTKKCHAFFENTLGVKKTLLTTSCSDALEMSALLLELSPGDEVVVPSFTFVSTVNACVLRGAKPVFVDIRPDTLNMDETLLEERIGPRTKVVLPVHYAGIGCEMDAILEISERRGVAVVEDNAHGLFGKYRGRFLGTFGSLATQSFHETKNITCGEGGALLINDAALIERAEILREKGTNRSRFFRGEVDKYTWVDIGSSFLPSDILAAFLYAQLEAYESIQETRRWIWETYNSQLADWASQVGARRPFVPDHCEQPYHMFFLIMPDLQSRQSFIAYLKTKDIQATFHYLPLHLSDMGKRFGGRPGDCPVTEDLSDRLVRLPFYNSMTADDQSRVIDAVRAFKC